MVNEFKENLQIIAKTSGFSQAEAGLAKLKNSLNKIGDSITNVGGSLTKKLTLPLIAIGGLAVKAFDTQAKAIAKVETGLKSTGGTVGRTLDQLSKQASDFQKKTRFGDEEILGGATSTLLTFANIRGKIFDETQQATLDLAARLDTDLKSAAIQLGKALNDPVANLSALSRAGIQFSDSQTQTINNLVKSNRLFDAQGIILKELSVQFGGTAEALGKIGAAPIVQLKNAIGDLLEDVGSIVMTAITPMINYLRRTIEALQGMELQTKKTVVAIVALAASIGPALLSLGLLIKTVTLLASPFIVSVAAVTAFITVLDYLNDSFTIIQRAMSVLNGSIFAILGVLLTSAKYIVMIIRGLTELGVVLDIIRGKETVFTEIRNEVKKLEDGIESLVNTFAGATISEFQNAFSPSETLRKPKILSPKDVYDSFFTDIEKQFNDFANKIGSELPENIADATRKENSTISTSEKSGIFDFVTEQAEGLNQVGSLVADTFTDAFISIGNGTKSIANAFSNLAQSIIQSLTQSALSNALGKLLIGSGGAFGSPVVPVGAATGGYIRGAGTGTSDSIPANLSDGEYVLNAKSVSHWGVGLLHKMNAVKKGFKVRGGGINNFAEGGQARASSANITFNLINNSSQPVSATQNQRFDGQQIIVETVLEDLNKNGLISQSLESNFGVKR